jgi:hypothetical protein
MDATLLDCSLRFNGSLADYRYSATFRVDGFTVRVRLCHDDCQNVSFAVAEVLDHVAWTRLLRTRPVLPAGHAGNVAGSVEGFARDLLEEARTALAGERGVA